MTKFKKLFDEMLSKNRELFIEFKIIHDQYQNDPKKYRDEFNRLGEQVLPIIREYENLVCGKSENSGYGKFSAKLAEKFQEEVKKNYPRIDFVGIK